MYIDQYKKYIFENYNIAIWIYARFILVLMNGITFCWCIFGIPISEFLSIIILVLGTVIYLQLHSKDQNVFFVFYILSIIDTIYLTITTIIYIIWGLHAMTRIKPIRSW
jgi:hypothetical protein